MEQQYFTVPGILACQNLIEVPKFLMNQIGKMYFFLCADISDLYSFL